MWYLEKQEGPDLRVQAFGEPGHPPEIPGPIIRVPEGTKILVNLRNAIPGATLVIHGLHTRPGNLDDIIQLGPGESRMTNQINASSALTLPNLPATIAWILEGNCRLAAP